MKSATLNTLSTLRWDKRVACMEKIKIHIALSLKKWTDHSADGNCRLEDNIKVSRKDIGYARIGCIYVAGARGGVGDGGGDDTG
jgi:hypothetical protein